MINTVLKTAFSIAHKQKYHNVSDCNVTTIYH